MVKTKYIAKAIQLIMKQNKKVTATDSKMIFIYIYIEEICVSSRILSYFKENKNKFKKPGMLFPIRFAYSNS